MAKIYNQLIASKCFDKAEDFHTDLVGTYLFYNSEEDRSTHIKTWQDNNPTLSFIEITAEETNEFTYSSNSISTIISLRSEKKITSFLQVSCHKNIFIDITGISRHIWPILLKIAFQLKLDVYIIYVEPKSYTKTSAPTEGQIYDLSEIIKGISPIPGFMSLSTKDVKDKLFVPLLGFEGARLAYMTEQIQPPNENIYPIIGLPGFKAEYPFETYIGNKRILLETGSWKRIRYASANCPFDVFYKLKSLSKEHSDKDINLALIGTKPQALGAILFNLVDDHPSEIFYDHPIKKSGRTTGHDRLHLYHVSILNT
jgi:hypothetical protein